MSEWRRRRIGDLGAVVTGTTPPANHPEWFGGSLPFITPTDIARNHRRAAPERTISDEGVAAMSKRLVPAGSVCFVCIGATIGKLCLTSSDALTNQQINTIVPGDDFDGTFIYYLLRQEAFRIAGYAGGAATPILNKGDFSTIEVETPDLPTQRSIASVLGSLDDFIESNRRRVEVLEDMARAIYREWFVRFRYPGHEVVPLIDSPLGPIPNGWSASTCGDELRALGGGTPSKSEDSYWDDGDIRWFTPSDLTKAGLRYAAEPEMRITLEGLARSSARMFPAGSVLMTSRATLGVLAIATFEATTNQGFIVIPPDDRWSAGFIYEWLDWHADDLASVATGATFKEITKGTFKRVPFVVPAQQVLDVHRQVTEPLDVVPRDLLDEVRASLSDGCC